MILYIISKITYFAYFVIHILIRACIIVLTLYYQNWEHVAIYSSWLCQVWLIYILFASEIPPPPVQRIAPEGLNHNQTIHLLFQTFLICSRIIPVYVICHCRIHASDPLSCNNLKAVAKKAQKKIGASMGFEPMTTSVIPVRCSTNCQLWAGQVQVQFTCIPFIWREWDVYVI